MKGKASGASAFFGRERSILYTAAVLKTNKQKNSTSCLRTLDINNLKSEGL